MGKSDQHTLQTDKDNGKHADINTQRQTSKGNGQIWDKDEKRLTDTKRHAK